MISLRSPLPRRALVATLAAGSLALAGCGSSPAVTFYALGTTPGTQRPQGAARAIRVRRPGVAGYLDRPSIVRRVVGYRLGEADTDQWASPLDVMIGRVLAQDIETRVPGSHVFTEDGAITLDPDATVEVDIQRFDAGEKGEIVLVAEVAIEQGAAHGGVGKGIRLEKRPEDATMAGYVAAMSDLLGQLADQVSDMLREAPPARAP